ncbi:MAG: hypothetical protein HY609_06830 [Deltaproteobacteria bacterium]|nr:hypothetical protein [Candidatus Chisholmbacteria bacterium]MBI4224634.1 hypothetical protein [Deltaproteobacteria bacterium]
MAATRVFLDTIAFESFINRGHPKHLSAIEAFESLARLNAYLYTSTLVIADLHDYLLANLGYNLAREFVKILPLTSIGTLRPTPRDESRAYKTINTPATQNIDYKTALHISMIARSGITHAFSTSPHFPQHRIALIGT